MAGKGCPRDEGEPGRDRRPAVQGSPPDGEQDETRRRLEGLPEGHRRSVRFLGDDGPLRGREGVLLPELPATVAGAQGAVPGSGDSHIAKDQLLPWSLPRAVAR